MSSGQDGGMGRDASFPRTIKRRITTNLKTINKQNCQNIKLHGTLITKELKKHSSRLVGGVEPGSGAERTHGKAVNHAGEAVAGRPGCLTFVG